MKGEESRISQLERKLARTQILVGVLVIISLARFYPAFDQIIKDSIFVVPLIIGGLILTVFLIYLVERFFIKTKKRMSKNMKKTISIILILAISAAQILAAKLKNTDSLKYDIQIIESSTITNSSIESGATIENICGECEIKIVGDDSPNARIKLGKDDVIVIKDGKLSKE